MEYQEWVELAKKETSGDMVWDILRDWKKDREDLVTMTALINGTLRFFREYSCYERPQ